MNPDFVRLALAGSRNALGRLAAIAGGIALGMAMILLLVGAYIGLGARDARGAWVNIVGTPVAENVVPAEDAVLVARVEDWFMGQRIGRFDIAAPAGVALDMPGMPAPPAPGSFYASPALAALIQSRPADLLGDRYGTLAGLIADSAMVGPDSLVAVVGQDRQTLLGRNGVLTIETVSGVSNGEGIAYRLVTVIGAFGMIFPVLLFVSIATRLGAAQRRETFSTLRLIGATPRQLGLVAGAETLLVAVVGVVLGIVLTEALRPLVALFRVNGTSFFPADLAVPPVLVGAVAVALVLAATFASLVGMWRSGIGPLGASRAMAERRPGLWRIVPLLVGLAAMAGADYGFGTGLLPGGLLLIGLLGGYVLLTVGLVLAGPLVTAWAGALAAKTAKGAAGVIAASRIARHPVAMFRSVSGLVVAVFMVTLFSAASGGVVATFSLVDAPERLPTDALLTVLAEGAEPGAMAGSDSVTGYRPADTASTARMVFAGADLTRLGFDASAAASHVSIAMSHYMALDDLSSVAMQPFDRTADLVPAVLVTRTDGTQEGIERARTALQADASWASAPIMRAESGLMGMNRVLAELATVAYTGAFVTIVIAGLSLALSTAGAMLDRKRVFGLLRLMGMPIRQLDRVIVFETAVPLVAVLALSVGLGYVAAFLILDMLSDAFTVGVPDLLYFGLLALGLLLALAMVAATLGMIRRNTAPTATRFE